MKKLMYIAVFGMALGFTSCSEEEAIDFACNTGRAALKGTVQTAIDAYINANTTVTCEAARRAIDEYKASECGDNSFDIILGDLPDCSTIVSPV